MRYWGDELHLHDGSSHTHAQLRELRLDVGGSFSPSERLTFSITAPLHLRSYTGTSWAGQYSGTGDLELGARVIAFRDRAFAPQHLVSAIVGARLPTAMALRNAGALLPQDAQLTTASTELRAGVGYSFFSNPWSTHLSVVAGGNTERAAAGYDNVRWSGVGQRQFGRHIAVRAGAEGNVSRHEGARTFGAADVVVSPLTDLTFQVGARIPLELKSPDRVGGTIGMLAAVVDF